jgi:hypothetical protein
MAVTEPGKEEADIGFGTTKGQMTTRAGDQADGTELGRVRVRSLRLLTALILVNGLLLAPWWIQSGAFRPPWLALEAGVIVGLFAVMRGGRRTAYAALAAAAAIVLATLVGLGDAAIRLSLGRPLNLYLDIWLLASVRDLLVGTLGSAVSLVVIVLAPVAVVLLVFTVAHLLCPIRVPPVDAERGQHSKRFGTVGLLAFVTLGYTADRVPTFAQQVDWAAIRLARAQVGGFLATIDEQRHFAEALALYPASYTGLPHLLSRLEGRDVIVGFLESYGMTAIEDPRYAPVLGPRLDDLETRMTAAGLHIVSGRLVAPSQGGQSWFAHGSLLSGVWLDNQMRYEIMLASGRETLIDDFERAGHRTVAMMPAITKAWPEGRRFGYDEIFARPDIHYAGPPLNWVTMPDQFSWSFLENAIREPREGPLFLEVGFISSHAPWTPILPVLDDWDSIGDGAVFARWGVGGERPEELWRDPDRVRAHYAMSVEYAVHAMTAYAERFVDEKTLLMVLGDHQPAPLITGEGAAWDVPVHVISGDAALLRPFLEWGFVEGAWPEPDPDREALGVDHFRDWFVHAYSGP